MARKASGADQVASARELLRTAKTADELRTAQAVLLPLERGLSLEMTARVIGRSIGATCNLRTRYSKGAWWSCLPSGNRSLNDWASRLRYRRSIGCWRAMAGASWRLTRPIPREILRRVRTGKKLQGNLDQIVASWNNDRPLRLMFQDEARFGRIPDTRYCWCRRPVRPLVYAMVTQHIPTPMAPSVLRTVASIAWCSLMAIPTACKSSGRDRLPPPQRQHHHGSRWCWLAQKYGISATRQSALALPATVFSRAEPARAPLGRAPRKAFPQPRLRQHRCP